MQLTLNIGMARKHRPNLTVKQVESVLRANGFLIEEAAVLQSSTEPTLVAVVEAHRLQRQAPVIASLYKAATALDQDCIAAYANGRGKLIGPNAAEWGDFNPEFFLLPCGSSLQPAALAA